MAENNMQKQEENEEELRERCRRIAEASVQMSDVTENDIAEEVFANPDFHEICQKGGLDPFVVVVEMRNYNLAKRAKKLLLKGLSQ